MANFKQNAEKSMECLSNCQKRKKFRLNIDCINKLYKILSEYKNEVNDSVICCNSDTHIKLH